MSDLASRLTNRVQLSSDGLEAYVNATERAFGANVDYGQIVKVYESQYGGPGRYSPPRVVDADVPLSTAAPTLRTFQPATLKGKT